MRVDRPPRSTARDDRREGGWKLTEWRRNRGGRPLPSPEGDRYHPAVSLLVDLTSIRVSRDFRRLWVGQAVSFVGITMTVAASPEAQPDGATLPGRIGR